MAVENQLNLGLSESETQKAVDVLSRLLPYVVQDNVVLVGGSSRRHHLIKHGVPFPQRPFNDLDLKIKDMFELNQAVTDEFLIYHYHLPQNSPFYVGLMDRRTRVTIDMFDYFHKVIDPEVVQFAGMTLQIRGAEDQLTKTVYDLLKITRGRNLSPKEFDSATQLLQIVDLDKAERIWRIKYGILYPFTLISGIYIAEEERVKHPERVFEFPNRTTEPYICTYCADVPNSPVAPMEEVIRTLGYIDKT